MRNDVLKYRSSITSSVGVRALWRQLELAKPGDSCKIIVLACREDEFPFMRAAPGCPPFFYVLPSLVFIQNFENRTILKHVFN